MLHDFTLEWGGITRFWRKLQMYNAPRSFQTFPRQDSWDCQNLILREVEKAGLVGPDGAMRMRGEPGSLLLNTK